MVAPFSGAGTPVRPDRIEGAEDGDDETEKASCAPTEIDDEESVAPTVIDEEEKTEAKAEYKSRSRRRCSKWRWRITSAVVEY